jgi:phosphohistidine phosphatase
MAMKTLLLLRHAKSSRDDPSLRDFDRPLNERGKDDAKRMGRFLRGEKLTVDVVISSPAKRARRTTELFLNAAKLSNEPTLDDSIYEAGLPELLRVLSDIDSSHTVAILIGHNPGFEELLVSLTGQTARMPTAALACIDLSIGEWRDVHPRSGKVRWLVTPKELKN